MDKNKKCKKAAEKLFVCFEDCGKQTPGTRDSLAGERVFAVCQSELQAYSSCMKKVDAHKNLRLVRAPQAYLDELGV